MEYKTVNATYIGIGSSEKDKWEEGRREGVMVGSVKGTLKKHIFKSCLFCDGAKDLPVKR